MCVCVCVCVRTKKPRNGVSVKTAIKQVNNNGRYKKGPGIIGNWEALMELYWDF